MIGDKFICQTGGRQNRIKLIHHRTLVVPVVQDDKINMGIDPGISQADLVLSYFLAQTIQFFMRNPNIPLSISST